MDTSNLCLKCMQAEYNDRDTCPSCGSQRVFLNPYQHLPLDSLLKNRYRIGRSRGRGDCGILYIAYDREQNRRVSVTEFFPKRWVTRKSDGCTVEPYFSSDAAEQFRREKEQFLAETVLAEAQTLLGSGTLPGNAAVYDTFSENETAYLVTEYIEGDALKKALEQTRTVGEWFAVLREAGKTDKTTSAPPTVPIKPEPPSVQAEPEPPSVQAEPEPPPVPEIPPVSPASESAAASVPLPKKFMSSPDFLFIGVLLALFLLFCAIALVINGNSSPYEDCWYLSDDGGLILTGDMPDEFDADAEIPWAGHRNEYTYVLAEEGVYALPPRAFAGCTALQTVILPSSLAKIGAYAFDGCTSLTELPLPDSLEIIGNSAFKNCTSIETLTIPSSVSWAGTSICEGWSSDQNIYLDAETLLPTNDWSYDWMDHCYANFRWNWKTDLPAEGICYERVLDVSDEGEFVLTEKETVFWSLSEDGVLTLSGSGHAGGTYGYAYNAPWYQYNIYEIHEVRVEEGVTGIGTHSFYGMEALTNVTLADSVTYIESSAFQNCTSLETVTNAESLTRIGDYAFSNCTSLREFRTPEALMQIGEDAFWNCTALQEFVLPDSLVFIGSGAFRNCTSIADITIPYSVITIEYDAFSGWIPTQTIHVEGYSSAPIRILSVNPDELKGDWQLGWDGDCYAEIVWDGE